MKKKNSIENYRRMKTERLQMLLKSYESVVDNLELLLYKHKDDKDIKQKYDDYTIDVNLIRMELTKRLWFEDK